VTYARTMLTPNFRVEVDHNRCVQCRRCVQECGWSVYDYEEPAGRIVADEFSCVGCGRCYTHCPDGALLVTEYPSSFRFNPFWTPVHINNVYKQSQTGGVLLTGMGNDRPYQTIFDHLVIDACQVTNPSIDPLREPMELRTYLGRKPDHLEFTTDEEGRLSLATQVHKQVKLEVPIIFAPMSFGALSLNAHRAMLLCAQQVGTVMETGEGGLHRDFYRFRDHIIVQVASGRFGVHQEYLNAGVAVEIKIGQGAKPGIGGHLPGEKVSGEISHTRMIPVGSDAISPAPQHDIYSIEDLRQLIYAIKEATDYKPVSVKIAAVHNVAAIASGIVRAGADMVYLDGFRGGTGAAPTTIRDHLGIPIEVAVAAVDEQLRSDGIRNQASIIAAGSIRSSSDAAKAIALGADAVAIGTAALITMGCHVCASCHTGNCSWGITTQRPELTTRLDPEVYAERLANLLHAWSHELMEILGALGVNAIESLRGSRERLRGVGLDEQTLDILGVKPAGR
jgi:glutamate synthase domain-containing protein 2